MFYEKYRPKRFCDVLGQMVSIDVLLGTVATGRIPSAVLFCGPHGTGKTTLARVFAKLLNCLKVNVRRDHDRPNTVGLEPCCSCNNCQLIGSGVHPDVIEIDAASKTGVDDVRSIIDSCAYLPLSAEYKIFIVDEMHMLSSSAVSALLKIVESPPDHVVFLFVTTDRKKLPLPILSRCQILLLKRHCPNMIEECLDRIAKSEHLDIDSSAISAIANSSGGSMRDAIVSLEQCANFAFSHNSKVTEKIVREVCFGGEYYPILNLVKALLSREISMVLSWVDDAYKNGLDLVRVLFEAQRIICFLAVHKACWMCKIEMMDGLVSWWSLCYLEDDELKRMWDSIDLEILDRIWSVLCSGIDLVKNSHDIYSASSMLLIRIVMTSKFVLLSDCAESNQSDVAEIPRNDIAAKESCSFVANKETLLKHNLIKDKKLSNKSDSKSIEDKLKIAFDVDDDD